MGLTGWLADKSAVVRLAESPARVEWASRVDRGLVFITSLTRLELGYSARSAGELRSETATRPLSGMPLEYLTPAAEDRAIEVQALLADRGRHRAPSVPDLLVAAAAELGGLTVLHLDKDFELIADVTGQPVERLSMP